MKYSINFEEWCKNNNREILLEEWNYVKNHSNPSNFSPKTSKKVWWKCSLCGYEWEATINNRANGSGCPKCNKRNRTSFPEQCIYYYIGKAFPDSINSYKDIFSNGMELDVYIPSINVGIEYDGTHWHNTTSSNRDKYKYDLCKKRNIKLIRIVVL